jgi:hypothetical protein
MYVGVIEWSSDSLVFPTVLFGRDLRDVLIGTGNMTRRFEFDDDDTNAIRDRYKSTMSEAELVAWYSELWDATTDVCLTVYVMPDNPDLPYSLTDGEELNFRVY